MKFKTPDAKLGFRTTLRFVRYPPPPQTVPLSVAHPGRDEGGRGGSEGEGGKEGASRREKDGLRNGRGLGFGEWEEGSDWRLADECRGMGTLLWVRAAPVGRGSSGMPLRLRKLQ